MKRKIVYMIFAVLILGVAGCGQKAETPFSSSAEGNAASSAATEENVEPETPKEENQGEETLGVTLVNVFKEEMKKGTSLEDTVNVLAGKSGYDCGTMECEEGFLTGFSEDVTGFKSAIMFSPYIGTIPFVGYVFETDDPEALKETLTSLANPRWNICTEAEETVVEVSGDFVFFAMCPGKDF